MGGGEDPSGLVRAPRLVLGEDLGRGRCLAGTKLGGYLRPLILSPFLVLSLVILGLFRLLEAEDGCG